MPTHDDDGDDAADALWVVSHELRLEILRALWAAEGHALSFSDLRTAWACATPDSSTTTVRN